MRKVHILMTVTMGGEDGSLDRGYYEDRELPSLLHDWISGEISMHDDSPYITHWDATVVATRRAED
ncbi:hypothetical protein [Streptomyces achromogenes]|uniref:hypothetical protein n=1 Tax=Streptomyces achromogenes TaxID=67255 RepID=UPI0036A8036D